MIHKNNWLNDYIIITVLALLAFCTYGVSPLLTPDEGRYAEIGREMLVHGQYIIPHINSIVYFEKPPLMYWLISLSQHWFGWSEWAARFWCAIFYVLTLFYTYFVIRKVYARKLALYTVFVLASSMLYLMITHMLTLDFGVTFFINLCLLTFWLCIHCYFDNKAIRILLLALAYVFMGCAIMCKGLIGVMLPVLALGLWLLIHQKWRLILKIQPLMGLVIIVAISLPWMLMAQQQYPDFLHFYIWVQQFERYFTPVANRSSGRKFYPMLVFLMVFPWSGFWYEIFAKIKWLWQHYSFFILWAFSIILFFALSHSILIPYLLPASLPLAVLVAACFEKISDKRLLERKGLYFITLLIFLILFVAFVGVLTARHITITPVIWAVVILFAIAVLLTIVGAFVKLTYKHYFVWMMLIFIVALDVLFLNTSSLQQRSLKQLALYVKSEQAINPNIKAYSFLEYYQDLPYYLQKEVYIVTNDMPPNELEYGYKLQHKQNPYVMLTPKFVKAWGGATPAYAFVKDQYLSAFEALFPKHHYCLLQKEYRVWLVQNSIC